MLEGKQAVIREYCSCVARNKARQKVVDVDEVGGVRGAQLWEGGDSRSSSIRMEVTQEAENLNEVGGGGGVQHGESGVGNKVIESQGEDNMCNPGILVERLEALVDNIEPSKSEVENKEAVLESLRRVLGNRFPEVELIPYGSSESGLALPGCDLDVFVFLGDEEEVIKCTLTLSANKFGF